MFLKRAVIAQFPSGPRAGWFLTGIAITAVLACASPRVAHAADANKVSRIERQLRQYQKNARKESDRSVPELIAQQETEAERGIEFKRLRHGDRMTKEVAITFDDGPHPAYTPKLLSILRQYHAHATFFLVGEMAERCPDLVRQEVADGHSIGNHTYHHYNLTKIPGESVAWEIHECGKVLRSITGKPTGLFRPPGGDYDPQIARIANRLGYTVVLWTDDPGDYAKPGAQVIESRLLDRIGNGGIILIHDGIQQTIEILPQLLEYLKRNGYQLVTVDQMLDRACGRVARRQKNEQGGGAVDHVQARKVSSANGCATHQCHPIRSAAR